MKIIRGLHNLPIFTKPCAVTIGNFDGLHLGHKAIIGQLKQVAKENNLFSVVVIFEPQPREFLDFAAAPPRLLPFQDKVRLLQETGIDYLLCLRFDEAFMRLSAPQFIQQILLQGLQTNYLLVGQDFRFGYQREGNLALLEQVAAQGSFTLASCPPILQKGVRISSTLVRQALQQLNLAEAASLLGRPYALSGLVRHGDKRGRLLGFPTANLLLKHDKLILQGVFAVYTVLQDRQIYQGVANIGLRPTVGGLIPKLEVHLINFRGDLYGQLVQVIFKHKLRDEQRFADLDALKTQITLDLAEAKQFFEMEKYHD